MALVPELVLRLGFGPEYEVAADALPLLGARDERARASTYLAVNYLLAVGATPLPAPALAIVALAEPVLLLAFARPLAVVRDGRAAVQLAAAVAVLVPTLRRAPAGAPARA